MVGDMMVVVVEILILNKVAVVVVPEGKASLVTRLVIHQLMDMVGQVFNFQQHSKILDLHQAELVELDHLK
jgi:uncharacterized membrane protein